MAGSSRHPWNGLPGQAARQPEPAQPQENAAVEAQSPDSPPALAASEDAVLPVLPALAVDAAQFTQLFASEAPRIWRALRRLGVPEGDVDDVCQEVFLVVYRRWAEFRGDSSLRTWVYGIAVRKALAHRRSKHARSVGPLSQPDGPPVAAGQARELERGEARAALCNALERLREGKREVFVLYELEELPMREVAALLETPLHTCYARLYAARAELAVALRRAGHDGGGG